MTKEALVLQRCHLNTLVLGMKMGICLHPSLGNALPNPNYVEIMYFLGLTVSQLLSK